MILDQITWTRKYLTKIKTHSYAGSKKNLPPSNQSLDFLRRKNKRRSFDQLPLSYNNIIESSSKINEESFSCIVKPNFFSFLDKKLEISTEKDINIINEFSEKGFDQGGTLSQGIISVAPKKSEDFLHWLGGKLQPKCDDSSYSNVDDDVNDDEGQPLIKVQYTCDICSKTYTSKNGLEYHMVSHSGLLTFQCKHCFTFFKSSSTLHRHVNSVHFKNKLFECKQCLKKFVQKCNLGKHMDSHLNIRKFKCHICQKSFVQRSHLKNHLVTHSGEKNYKCNACNSHFVKQYCLDRHMKNIHKI